MEKQAIANVKIGQTLSNGFEVLAVKQVSKNPADSYLQYVLAFKTTELGNKFVTWLYNECGQGCHNGHYFDTWEYDNDQKQALKAALLDFHIR
jgi:hypothetical protein